MNVPVSEINERQHNESRPYIVDAYTRRCVRCNYAVRRHRVSRRKTIPACKSLQVLWYRLRNVTQVLVSLLPVTTRLYRKTKVIRPSCTCLLAVHLSKRDIATPQTDRSWPRCLVKSNVVALTALHLVWLVLRMYRNALYDRLWKLLAKPLQLYCSYHLR